uniref:zinc transporter 9-like n=1 Tax=Arvicanthis niloticus TaxID=61156 RepID=UPI001486432F|nr:zinc transporter 9-like [Arvicanthis niloticus]
MSVATKMGTSPSCPMKVAIHELLDSKGLKFKDRALAQFLSKVEAVAPWFAVSGNLSLACWDKLGRDLDRAWEEGTLQDKKGKTGVRGIWRVIRTCLTSEECVPAIQSTMEALEQVKEMQPETRSTSSKQSKEREKGGVCQALEKTTEALEQLKEEEVSEGEFERLEIETKLEIESTAPGPPWPPPNDPTGSSGRSFCPEAWRELRAQCFMVAICINGLNCFFKFLAWIYTGSASMFSEAIHSLSDTCNQGLLALDISKSIQTPDSFCPYGFSNMRYISSLISGVGIFMMGAGLSWYHGVMGLLHPQPMESLLWAYCILAGSLVYEGATLLVAISELCRSAQAKGMSFYKYVMERLDPSTNVVLLGDATAVLGVIIMATCMGLTSITGNPLYDSLGSLGVGILLGVVSAFLIYTSTEALLGRSVAD